MADAPPRPPPHGSSKGAGGLPDGNYDIFIIPPHSAGSGFLYLPSLKPNPNSFIAGFTTAMLCVGFYNLIIPAVYNSLSSLNTGVIVLFALIAVIAAFSYGRTMTEPTATSGGAGPESNPDYTFNNSTGTGSGGPGFDHGVPGPKPPDDKPAASSSSSSSTSSWEKAREETRRREQERKRAEELRAAAAAAAKKREEAEKAARAAAEKERWDQARAREKDSREKEARERIARERAAREKDSREKEARERIARERAAREAATKKTDGGGAAPGYQRPTAQSATDNGEYGAGAAAARAGPGPGAGSGPQQYRHPFASSGGSMMSEQSESSYAPSMSTARTTPPPSNACLSSSFCCSSSSSSSSSAATTAASAAAPAKERAPYATTDANKVIIQGVFLYTNVPQQKAQRMLIRGQGSVSDGLILRLTTEGMFIDDDVRKVPQREWDIKAWGIKLVELGRTGNLSLCRVTMRDVECKRYLFVLPNEQSWKVDVGLERLRKGSQVRCMGFSTIKEPEARVILSGLGW